MNIGAVIQARTQSIRFPKKVFAEINGLKILDRIFISLYKCKNLSSVILAYPSMDEADFAQYIKKEGPPDPYVYGGSMSDVLIRIIGAAEKYNLDAVVRICADSPFILPWLIDYGVDVFKKGNIDYLSTRCFPKGQNIEIIKTSVLKKIYSLCNSEEKEHVTLYLEQHHKDHECRVLDIEMVVDQPADVGELTKVAKYYD